MSKKGLVMGYFLFNPWNRSHIAICRQKSAAFVIPKRGEGVGQRPFRNFTTIQTFCLQKRLNCLQASCFPQGTRKSMWPSERALLGFVKGRIPVVIRQQSETHWQTFICLDESCILERLDSEEAIGSSMWSGAIEGLLNNWGLVPLRIEDGPD